MTTGARNSDRPLHVLLRIQNQDGGFRLAAPAGALPVDPDVWDELVERAATLPRSGAIRVTVAVPADDLVQAASAREGIHLYFGRRRAKAEHELRRDMHAGWLSLAIGVVVLLALLTLSRALGRLESPSGMIDALREGLSIVGWVALWRPAELLLFSPWTFRRDIELFRRLERAEVQIVPETSEGSPPPERHQPTS